MTAAATLPAPDRTLTGIALMVGFCVIAPLIDVFAKLAAAEVPVGVVTFGRFAVQYALMLPLAVALGLSLRLSRRMLWLTFLRAVLSVVSTICFIAALRFMPIADALAIVFVEPFIILLIGKLALGEQVGPRRLAACAVGFVGSMFVIQPSLAVFGPVALFPLGTAVSFALYMLITRAMSGRIHPVATQVHTSWMAGLICLPLFGLGQWGGIAALQPVAPQGVFWLWVGLTGLAATASHLAITYALTLAPSSTIAPLHYLEIVGAVGFGYLVFSDFPDALTWAGIAIIVASGLYIIHRERVAARQLAGASLALSEPR